ncbi:MAG TPA: sigma-70 family RNA polymerase sigma factor [Gemmatimonadales bacterium]|nr:sigma-70 family RNA polymerase sigma factor [Gemmatimonadales bacterium]
MPDRELVRRMSQGDEAAVGLLYDRHGAVLYQLAHRIVGQRADAEEVVMDTFAQAWRDAPRFEPERGSVGAWLTMIARSRALDLVRARDRRERAAASAAQETASLPERPPADPAGAVELAERRRRVELALGELSLAQRTAIELAFYEGLSQSEIADRLDEPLGTIKTRIRLGMQKLREALGPYRHERGA